MTRPLLRTWPPLPPDAWLQPPSTILPFPLDQPSCRWFARGRHALWHGVRALGLGAGDEVLVPAYHHGSEIEALARAGLSCRFYGGDARLAPDEGELDALLGPHVRALLLIHYLGFPQDAPHWRRWCDDRGLLLLEDAAQAWLAARDGRPVGTHGELAIFCLYKSVGVADGAALVVRGAGPEPADGAGSSWASEAIARRHAAWVAARSPAAAAAFRALQRRGTYDRERDFALEDPTTRPARSTPPLTARLAHPGVAAGRRARYAFLLAELADRVPEPFDRLQDGAAPFAFPIAVEDAPRLADRLAHAGIEALPFWSQPHPSLPAAFPDIGARRRRTLALPVHQELRPTDLDRLVAAVRGPARRRAELRLEPIEDLDGMRQEWTGLAAAVGDPFASWEWAVSWCRHVLGHRSLHLLACRGGGGRLVGILPLYESARRPLRILRFLGSGPADRQGPICLAGDRAAVGRALRRALDEGLRCDVLLAERLPGEAGWSAFIGGRVMRREASPVLRIAGRTWDELLGNRSAHFRRQVRRQERRLDREFTLGFRLADDPERLAADLATLEALHGARWTEGGSEAFPPRLRPFHAELAARAMRGGWLRLWFLELDGRPVAAWYGFRHGNADWFYQTGRDPAYDDRSVGSVLLAHTVREAAGDGVRTYHFLRGDEPYKTRFASEDPGLDTVVVSRSARGRAASAGARTTLLLPARTRRVVARAVPG